MQQQQVPPLQYFAAQASTSPVQTALAPSQYPSHSPAHTAPHNARRLASAARYCSRDVASEPPTSIMIVRDISELDSHDPASRFYVLESDVEPTSGWHSRFQKLQLSICFMHSFGKCIGRYHNDPSTCHQIHVRQAVIDDLRRSYINPVRRFFSRTVKAFLSLELLSVISQFARKDLTLQYLEYLAQDVQDTEGLRKYEASYRAWLTAPGGFQCAFHDITVPQCADYALRGSCALGRDCHAVHAHLHRAQVRDNIVVNALRQISAPFDTHSGTVSPHHHQHGEEGGSLHVSPALSPRYHSLQGYAGSRPLSGSTSPQQMHQLQFTQSGQQHFAFAQPPAGGSHLGGSFLEFSARCSPPSAMAFQAPAPPPHLQPLDMSMQGGQYVQMQPPQQVYYVVLPQQSAPQPPGGVMTQVYHQTISPQYTASSTVALDRVSPSALSSADEFTLVGGSRGSPQSAPVSPEDTIARLCGQLSPGSQPLQLCHQMTTPPYSGASFSTLGPQQLTAMPQQWAAHNSASPSAATFVPSVYRVDGNGAFILHQQ